MKNSLLTPHIGYVASDGYEFMYGDAVEDSTTALTESILPSIRSGATMAGGPGAVLPNAGMMAQWMSLTSMPMAQAVRLCPRAVVAPVPMGACRDRSRAIRKVLGRWAPVVGALQAVRGVSFVTAVGLVVEVGDIRRFDHPRQLMAFLGLVPSVRGDKYPLLASSPAQSSERAPAWSAAAFTL